MALTGCAKFGKTFLIFINIIFFLLGLGLSVVGILMKVNVSAISDEVKPALNNIDISGFKFGDLVDNLSIGFIAIGVFILLVSGLGLFGACCEAKCMLVTYAILVMILFIAKVVVVALWFVMRSELNDVVKKSMLSSLQEKYKNDTINSGDEISNGWNYMFMSLDCCGVNDTKKDFDKTPWKNVYPAKIIPRTCCTGVDSTNYFNNPKPACTAGTSGFNQKVCYDAIQDEITTYGNIFVGVGITILLIELMAVVFACMICSQTGKDEVV